MPSSDSRTATSKFEESSSCRCWMGRITSGMIDPKESANMKKSSKSTRPSPVKSKLGEVVPNASAKRKKSSRLTMPSLSKWIVPVLPEPLFLERFELWQKQRDIPPRSASEPCGWSSSVSMQVLVVGRIRFSFDLNLFCRIMYCRAIDKLLFYRLDDF